MMPETYPMSLAEQDFRLDFIGVGVAKAGTTWLTACLDEHPQICMSRPKELAYFCTKQLRPSVPVNNRRGEKWLQSRFSHWQEGQIRGEFSTCYLLDSSSPVLIKERFPRTKIIVSFRNPVDALYSYYYQIGREFTVPLEFEAFLDEQPHFLQIGYYYTYMKRYFECFSQDNIHCIFYDDIKNNPEKVLSSLFDFLGIQTHPQSQSGHKSVNERQVVRSVLLRNFFSTIRDYLNTRPQLSTIKRLLTFFGAEMVMNTFYAANLRSAEEIPPMRKETRIRLVEIYGDEVASLGHLLNRDLQHWNDVRQ